ncbi:DUF4174 domain-containing protein [Christiangramia sediminicola]|uniref:DUF4174 domain-containing protein n=1 Tax=Christiangramia sediminicola TaxID=3073267 RepID=A0ABU1ET16_9FLAO|nr:DUF4174 domain-containing protein [Christiangramia sp. SM2212]MDR5591540.1 DUF4174 domain-containing protein [Christiangramia sp. SM2212]
MKKLLILGILICTLQTMNSQDLKEYQWENRLVVVFSTNHTNEIVQQQLEIFKKNKKDFEERKLIMIQAVPGKHKEIFPENSDWKKSDVYNSKKETDSEFEVILLGLDGGVKLRQSELLQTKKLFGLIDSMPMRRAEMRDN